MPDKPLNKQHQKQRPRFDQKRKKDKYRAKLKKQQALDDARFVNTKRIQKLEKSALKINPIISTASKPSVDGEQQIIKRKRKKQSGDGKMCLSTNSKDYSGAIDLPEKVSQREFETTGQFFRRLDRLVAKAKVEANMGARFDLDSTEKNERDRQRQLQQADKKPGRKSVTIKSKKSNNAFDDDVEKFNKRRKRRY